MINILISIVETDSQIEAEGKVVLATAVTEKEDNFSLKVRDLFNNLLVETKGPNQVCSFYTKDKK